MAIPLLLVVAFALLVAAWGLHRAAKSRRAGATARDDSATARPDGSATGVRDDSAPDRQPDPGAAKLEATRATWRPVRAARPRSHPIVLAHGLLGFGTIGVAGFRHDYFRGVPARLRAIGVEVRCTRVAPVAGIEARARQLADQIRALDAERVNVIAHSMGGLDARIAIAEMGIPDRVASLVTVGTPHHGTPLADGGAALLGVLRRLGVELAALDDLRTERMQELNRRIPDVPGVVYLSYVGVTTRARANVLLRPSTRYLERCAGPNDGLVPGASQRWGVVLGEIDADHWAQIGWGAGFDAVRFYEALALRLRGLGL